MGVNSSSLPDFAAVDQFLGFLDEGIMTPVMTDQERNALAFCSVDQNLAVRHRRRERLLDKDRAALRDAFEPLLHMKRSWCRQDDTIRFFNLEQFGKRSKPGQSILVRIALACITGIDNARQRNVSLTANGLCVTFSNQADARNAQANRDCAS